MYNKESVAKKFLGVFIGVLILAGVVFFHYTLSFWKKNMAKTMPLPSSQIIREETISLPSPKLKGETSLEETILKRRSRREYQEKSLTLQQISQLLWSGQGITNEKTGFRTAPSAGALYPLDIYVVAGEKGVQALEAGVYRFISQGHQLKRVKKADLREEIMRVSLNQAFIAQAPVILVITAEYERTIQKYGERGKQYVHMEAGHAAQNICLQVESLNLATVTVGAFDEKEISQILNLSQTFTPLYVIPIGYPK